MKYLFDTFIINNKKGNTFNQSVSFFFYHVLQIIAIVPNAAKARMHAASVANADDAIKVTIFCSPLFFVFHYISVIKEENCCIKIRIFYSSICFPRNDAAI